MDKVKFSEQILDYLENSLSPEKRAEFESAMTQEPELKKLFSDYQKTIRVEKQISEKNYELHPNFTVKVMNSLESEGNTNTWRFIMELIQGKKLAYRSIAIIAIAVVGLKLYQIKPVVEPKKSDELISTVKQSTVEPKEATSIDLSELESARQEDPSVVVPQPLGNKTKAEGTAQKLADLRSQPETLKRDIGKAASAEKVMGLEEQSAPAQRPRVKMPAAMVLPEMAQDEMDRSTRSAAGSYLAFGREMPVIRPMENEEYIGYTENIRTLVSEQSTSTFSIDVDTGSYTNARRYLSQGKLPPKNSIRVEEFINYFDYNYPVQTQRPFTLSYEIAPSPLDTERYFLKLGIKAKDVVDSGKPWNLTFLVDVSGSMSSPDKLELVKRSLKVLVNTMREQDKISLVTYAGRASLALEATSIKEKSKILSAIDGLSSGGSTAGEAGIKLAYDVTERNRIAGGVNRVILATDGDFNVGLRSHDELISLIENKRKSGTTLTTIGVGVGNIREGMMEQLANKGNGNYFYLDSFKEARKVFETEIAGTIEVVAKDVKLQIEFNPEHIVEYRLVGYENRKLKNKDFNNDKIDAGEIGSGHTVTAIYEVVLADSPLAKELQTESRYLAKKKSADASLKKGFSGEIAFLKIRHKAPESDKSTLLEFPIKRSDIKQSSDTTEDFRFASSVAYFGQLLRGSEFVGDYNYDDVAKLAQQGLGKDEFGYRREFVELVKNAAAAQ